MKSSSKSQMIKFVKKEGERKIEQSHGDEGVAGGKGSEH